MAITDTITNMFNSEEKNLRESFISMLQDIYDAEHRILEALPQMAEAATSSELKSAFTKHQTQTEGQVDRLEKIFASIDEEAERKTCAAIKGLIEEGEEAMSEFEEPALDAMLLADAQAVEHYEMARYGTLIAWAEEMGHIEAARLLKQTLKEEEQTDELLTKLAEKTINHKAALAIPGHPAVHGRAGSRSTVSARSR